MIEMVRRFLRQKSRSGGTLVLLGLLAGMSGLSIVVSGGPGGPGGGGYIALLVLAAASVSKDASSGALQMILARPIRRTDYLFGRYLGIVVAFAAFSVACVALGLLTRTPLGLPRPRRPARAGGEHRIRHALGRADGGRAHLFLDVPAGLRGCRRVAAPADLRLAAHQRASGWSRRLRRSARDLLPSVAWEGVFRGHPDALARRRTRRPGGVALPHGRGRGFFPKGVCVWTRLTPAPAPFRDPDPSRPSLRSCSGSCSPPCCSGS